MKVNSDIFRAYDIRGIVDKELTEEGIFFIGKALGTYIISEGRNSLLTARDGRNSGPRLLNHLHQGVLSSGCNVIDIGMVPTPLLYYATFKRKECDGVMLTGSHNPKNYNGLKIVIDRKSMTSEKIEKLKLIIKDEEFSEGSGKIKEIDMKNDYLSELKEKINIDSNLKICLDCGNGVGGVIAPDALRQFNIDLIDIFSEVDGNFPNHHPDPSNPKNLEILQKKVIETDADLGIALDGDGDRVGLVDSEGKIIYPDLYMMLLVEAVSYTHLTLPTIYSV